MARLKTDFPQQLLSKLEGLGTDGLPQDVIDEMLRAGAAPLAAQIRTNARALGVYDTGKVLRSIRAGKPENRSTNSGGGRQIHVGPLSRAKHDKKAKGKEPATVSAVGFYNEYGHGRQHPVAPRHYISQAVQSTESAVIEAEARVLDQWISDNF